VAVIDATGLYHVVTDHLYRPVALFDSSGAEVWSAVWEPFGALYSLNGSVNLDARFPGQWYQLETGLHYNWHRHYDPTLGRYTQADPVGMPDGPNRFSYVRNNPLRFTDPFGLRLKGGARPSNCNGPPLLRGKDIHDLFEDLVETMKPEQFEFNKGPFSWFRGRPDVYAPTTGDTFEIKPTTYGDGWRYDQAADQVNSYVNSASHFTWARPGSWSILFEDLPNATIIDPYYGKITFEPDTPDNTGLIFYSCEPPPPACYPN
jgi:RHS repeat-associated protein